MSAAVRKVESLAAGSRLHRDQALNVLIETKHYAEAEEIAMRLILRDPANAENDAALERLRAVAFRQQGKAAEGLMAARTYYDTAMLKDTADAINVAALALGMAHPDDPGIVHRFKLQQMAGATTAPSTQPAVDLGPPVLASVHVDPTPFQAALSGMVMDDYKKYVLKGNLLLLSGEAKQARVVFEQAYDLAPPQDLAAAVENVARALRANRAASARPTPTS